MVQSRRIIINDSLYTCMYMYVYVSLQCLFHMLCCTYMQQKIHSSEGASPSAPTQEANVKLEESQLRVAQVPTCTCTCS